ncbi:PREDICTED: pentatricopeptide repeat-containing protein At1g62680, mitochondrial [Nelumbo nucifera]|uniref:Pentatricopeptide repeat-containing protein n=2 Tax=Nelumbo nucifera TaxID=4432 RepID=A0A822Z2K9_NELNU|nr:PREDICTED: pentatricopeptide repeat-containing protein At1g62680, mitochondrial [Nelumbo nucifera]DAD35728.1 TPA_asm: hypothetical protein HUJ06_006368 [Nelumbo nucifera]
MGGTSQLLQNFLKNGRGPASLCVEDALLLFDEMVRLRPFPPVWAFDKLLASLGKAKLYTTAISLYRKMGSLPIRPTLYTLNMVMNFFCHSNRADLGFSLFGIILKRGYEPDVVTFTTMIRGLCAGNEIAQAMELFYKIIDNGSYMYGVVTYGTIINGLCKTRNTCRALRILREMEKKGQCKPDLPMYSTIIDGLCKLRRDW